MATGCNPEKWKNRDILAFAWHLGLKMAALALAVLTLALILKPWPCQFQGQVEAVESRCHDALVGLSY